MAPTDGFKSLAQDVNKVREKDTTEGVLGDLTPELTLAMDDEALIKLKKQWLKQWTDGSKELAIRQDGNENYWLGKQFGSELKTNPIDNLIFESLETFLPIATRPKAEPIVDADNSDQGNALANNVRRMISKKADDLSFNIKLKQVARFWSLYYVGVMKLGWSIAENDITCQPVRPQKLILDWEATVEDCEYKGEYLGEYRKDTASSLIARFPAKKKEIEEKAKDKMGTSLQYIEWWTPEYLFWTMDDEVLGKTNNPHWNYNTQQPAQMDQFGQQPIDPSTGQPQIQDVPGKNHFKTKKIPYVFLSVFNIGKHPVDDTSLIEQNKGLQDLINKRLKQIDNNADDANNGWLVSGDSFTKEQAAGISKALRKGGTVFVPTGPVDNAAKRAGAAPLPNFIYESLIDYRNELRNIFGTRGSSPQGTIGEKTVRGKIITKGQDSDRIGGGVSVFLEQFSDRCFNWFVQLMYVYYDEPHTATVLGRERSAEYIKLSNADFIADLTVSVKEGSMVPTDPMTKRSEAIDLWTSNGIDPITFFDRLEFPNPRESAKQLFLWMSDPIQLFPDLVAQQQPQQTEKPSESINYKDLPPEGQAQMAAQAGIQLHPVQIAQHQANQDAQKTAQAQAKAKVSSDLNKQPIQ